MTGCTAMKWEMEGLAVRLRLIPVDGTDWIERSKNVLLDRPPKQSTACREVCGVISNAIGNHCRLGISMTWMRSCGKRAVRRYFSDADS